jgi:hypothetical protein
MRLSHIAVALSVATAAFAEPPKNPPGQGGVVWEASYELAKQKAAGEGKLLFVDILTDG